MTTQHAPQTMNLSTLLNGFADIPYQKDIQALSNDSRIVDASCLFLAYAGIQNDGRDYIAEAIAKGAQAVVYDNYHWQLPKSLTTIDNTPLIGIQHLQRYIGEIAARFYHHPSHHLQTIGITGTNGKTSCAHYLSQALSALGINTATLGTLGNGIYPALTKTTHTTLQPLLLQQQLAYYRQQGATAAVMEVSSHALAQHRVVGVEFDTAVFTQLSRDHLDFHGTMRHYSQAKELLFKMPGLTNAVINIDDKFGRQLVNKYQDKLNIYTYSIEPQTQKFHCPAVIAHDITLTEAGCCAKVQTPWGDGELETQLLGRFNISNILAILTVLGTMNIPLEQALDILKNCTNANGRLHKFGNHKQPTVIVDYAHTPDALKQVLITLREHCQGQLICVFGCGGDRDAGKRREMASIVEQYADKIIMTNDNPRTEEPRKIINDMLQGIHQPSRVAIQLDRQRAIHFAVQNASINDMVLVAGKGHETTQIIGDTVLMFDDSQQVKQALKEYC